MKYKPYSVSKLGTYNQCPYKFKLNYIDKIKVPFETNKALLKGSHIHKILENNFDYGTSFKTSYVYNQNHMLETFEIVRKFENSELGDLFKQLIPISNLEENFAFNFDKELTKYRGDNTHFRGSADLYYVKDNKGFIFDYKSGKDKSKEEFGYDQACMYAIYMFIRYPNIDNVKAVFVFIEHNTTKSYIFTKDQLNAYLEYFKSKVNIIENDNTFKKKPSALCNWCSFKEFGHCTGEDDMEFELDHKKLDWL